MIEVLQHYRDTTALGLLALFVGGFFYTFNSVFRRGGQLFERHFTKMEDKFDDMVGHIGELKVEITKVGSNLETHIVRTENRMADFDVRLRDIETRKCLERL